MDAPIAFRVQAPYPNPFRTRLTLAFMLPEAAAVRADVYDVSGRLVRSLGRGQMEAGERLLAWDGRTGAGAPASPGLYFVRLTAGAHAVTRRVVLER